MGRTILPSLVCVALLAASPARAEVPSAYYQFAEGTSGEPLRTALHAIVAGHTSLPWNSSGFDVHDAIDWLDEDPMHSDQVALIYANTSVPKNSWPAYNREHVWPQSLGADDSSDAHTDLHHVFACDAGVNSARNNLPYGDCLGGCTSPDDAPEVLTNGAFWEAPDGKKGDLARALFYMDMRYEGANGEPDLQLQNILPSTGCDCMSSLSTLLLWHAFDPVDDHERLRNERVFSLQGNRNPFVDHPEWVQALWNGESIGGMASAAPWVNELHYDNVGGDEDEGIEIAGPAGTPLGGWSLHLYNGTNGLVYDVVSLSGVLADESGGHGAAWFEVSLQNGTDGVALIDPTGAVEEFLSYEGSFVANDGPAVTRASTNLPVAQGPQNPVGFSLQRVGDGMGVEALTWLGARPHSGGSLNADQTLWPTPEAPPAEVSLKAVAEEDGSIREISQRANAGGRMSPHGTALIVGDDARNRASRAILSFDTTSIPTTATLVDATIHLTGTAQWGHIPWATHGPCALFLLPEGAGSTDALELEDWNTNGIFAGWVPPPAWDGAQVAISLTAEALSALRRGLHTQFAMRFEKQDDGDLHIDQIHFASGNHPVHAWRPQLVITAD
jgi:endonuclease I